jgi:hypothetical protein
MDLSRTAAVTRPRAPMESIDLGFALARRWFLPLWICWWVVAAPTALLTLALLHGRPGLWLLLIWWCKPAFEALPLYWLSRAFFAERLPLATAVRRLPEAFPPRLWPQLVWRRIGLARSFTMPVTLLEAPRGPARGERLRVLHTGAAGWLTVICVHLESVLWIGGLLSIAFLIPEGLPGLDLRAAFLEEESAPYWVATLMMLLVISLMAPFYVAAGFALYLGRRTRLEAWDLELAFRRARSARAARPGAGFKLSLTLALLLLLPPIGQASTLEPTAAEARALIDEILAAPDFGTTREEEVWVYIGERDDDPADPDPLLPGPLLMTIAEVLKWVLLAAAAVAVALIALRVVQEYRWRGPRRSRSRRIPQASVEDLPTSTEQALPANLQAVARRMLAAGDARGALALLYRGQIAHLRGIGAELPDSATEHDCLNAAAVHGSAEELDWSKRLIRLWRGVAYAHRTPDIDALSSLLDDLPDRAAVAASHG